jgi:hypothetical protein
LLGPAPEHLGVALPAKEQFVRVLNEMARVLEIRALDQGIHSLVPMLVDDLGLQLTRRVLVGGLQVVPESAFLKHDFVIVSWRIVELQGASDARATALEILRLYPGDWVNELPRDRRDIVRLILLAALRHAGRETEARRYLEAEVRPGVTNPESQACLDLLMAMPQVDAASWCLLGADGGAHIEAECSALVPFEPLSR